VTARLVPSRAPVVAAALARDPFVRTFLVLAVVEWLFIGIQHAGWLPNQHAAEAWLFLPFHVLRIAAVIADLSAVRSREERWFWGYFGAAFSLWTLAKLGGVGDAPGLPASEIVVPFLVLSGDLLLLLAMERMPHMAHAGGRLDLDRRSRSIAVSSVVGGFFVYFVVVPALVGQSEPTIRLGYFSYAAFDALVAARILYARRGCRSPRWKNLYAAVGLALGTNAIVDMAAMVVPLLNPPAAASLIMSFLPMVVNFGYVVAVRYRQVPSAVTGVEPEFAAVDPLNPLRTGSLLFASALLFPLVHFGVYAFLNPGPAAAWAHTLTTMVAMSVLGVAAVVAYRVLERQFAQQDAANRLGESRVQLAYRMEEIGRMAGGVAHDFNSLLTVISGYAEMAITDLPEAHPSRALVDQIVRLAARAADLTRQLLAFSRRQSIQMVEVDVNAVVAHVAQSLRGWMGEDVAITTDLPGHDPLLVRASAGGLESILLNLAASARDSMPRGGELRIAARAADMEAPAIAGLSVQPGPHAALTVRDTGEPVPPALLTRIFEPFVSPIGHARGAGLNLAAAYGLVLESNGAIWASLPPDGGVEYTILLRMAEKPEAPDPA
jgi:signal transduction histidine kinase